MISNLKELDMRILVHIRENVKINREELSKKLNVPKSIIRTRIEKLKDRGYLQHLVTFKEEFPELERSFSQHDEKMKAFKERAYSFCRLYSLGESHEHLWQLLKLCFSGDLYKIKRTERANMLTFYEELTQLITEFYKYAEADK